jgi:transcriptional regulator with XRE-family HTH domain
METESEHAMTAFRERMKVLADRFGGVSKFARAAGLGESTVRKWTEGPSEPNRSKLVLLAQTAGVSVEWLATGEGPRAGLAFADQPEAPEKARPAAPRAGDGIEQTEEGWSAPELATLLAIGAAVQSLEDLPRAAQVHLVLRIQDALRALAGGRLPQEHELTEADLRHLAALATALAPSQSALRKA